MFDRPVGTWRSLVARTLGVREVAGSNPVVPTIFFPHPFAKNALCARPGFASLPELLAPPNTMPHIVITNDDGIYAQGLRALVDALQGAGTVSVVAPSQERSAAAQSLTLRQPIFCERVAEREWSVEGTPTDAMMVALHQLFAQPPDLVISGINRGGNMGENVFYSGTVGAAMEAAINRVPAFAISLVHRGAGLVYADAAAFARRLAETILAEGLPEGLLLNVNVPPVWNGSVRFTRQSKKVTRNVLEKGVDAQGRTFYWLADQQSDRRTRRGERHRGGAGRSRVGDAARDRPHARRFARSSLAMGKTAGAATGNAVIDPIGRVDLAGR